MQLMRMLLSSLGSRAIRHSHPMGDGWPIAVLIMVGGICGSATRGMARRGALPMCHAIKPNLPGWTTQRHLSTAPTVAGVCGLPPLLAEERSPKELNLSHE